MESLIQATHTRHDLVHRAGKTKAGDKISINKDDVNTLLNEVISFAEHIEKAELKSKKF
jgi:hypothetical protein